MNKAGATVKENGAHGNPKMHKSPFANMTPSAALTKHHLNMKSRIKEDALRTSSGAFVHSKADFSN
jgi:hypothetical protein